MSIFCTGTMNQDGKFVDRGKSLATTFSVSGLLVLGLALVGLLSA